MPLLRNGQWANDNPWIYLDDDTPIPESASTTSPQLCSLDRFLSLEAAGLHTVSGVRLKPEDDVVALANHLHHIQLIVIDFPQYTDGRGYSQARVLRKHLNFYGELRASGDIRPDQILFMMRAGIDAFDFKDAPDEKLIKQILTRYQVNYQPSYALPVAG